MAATHYDVLGVSQTATTAEIKKAYRKLILQNHPDKKVEKAEIEAATEYSKRLNEAYDVLGDASKKQLYDLTLQNASFSWAFSAASPDSPTREPRAFTEKAQPNSLDSEFLAAAKKGDLAKVKELLAAGAQINIRNEFDFSALMLAAEQDHVEVVKLLLGEGADVDLRNDNMDDDYFEEWAEVRSALMLAAENGHVDVVRALLEKNATMDFAEDGHDLSALALAAGNGHLEVVQLLIANNAELEGDTDSPSSLICAARNGHYDVMQCLIGAGANVELMTYEGESALTAAAENGHEKAVELLLKWGVNVCSEEGSIALMLAYENGHATIVALLIRYGAKVDPEEGYASETAENVADNDITSRKRKGVFEEGSLPSDKKRTKLEIDADILEAEADEQAIAAEWNIIGNTQSSTFPQVPRHHNRNPLEESIVGKDCGFFHNKVELTTKISDVKTIPGHAAK